MESAFTLFRQHGGRVRRQRKRARDKTGGGGGDNEEAAIVAAIAKTGGGGGGGSGMEDEEGRSAVGLPPARRAKTSINIFEDVDDRWVDMWLFFEYIEFIGLGWVGRCTRLLRLSPLGVCFLTETTRRFRGCFFFKFTCRTRV